MTSPPGYHVTLFEKLVRSFSDTLPRCFYSKHLLHFLNKNQYSLFSIKNRKFS